jgi:polysaccharide export outer membrane protein
MKKIAVVTFILFCGLFFVAGADAQNTYRISPGDELEISVWKDESLSRQLIVPPDGQIAFPLIGDINANNMTVSELRSALKKRLSEYIPEVTVTVLLLSANSMKAYVIGKVQNPGEFPISLDTNVMQVLAMAGGTNPFASEGNIIILRQNKEGVMQIPFDYKKVSRGDELEQNIFLQRGDVVVVP